MLRVLPSLIVGIFLTASLFTISWSAGEEGSQNPTRRDYPSVSGESSIDDVATSHIIGEEPRGRFGSRSLIRDLNRDGYDDLILNAPEAPGVDENPKAGRAYIWWGGDDLILDDIDLNVDEPDVLVKGNTEDSAIFGDINTGDLDSDGHLDLIVANPAQPNAGKMYVLWGNGSWDPIIELDWMDPYEPNDEPWAFNRSEERLILGGYQGLPPNGSVYANYQLGRTVIIEDMDQDGYEDLLFTSHGWENITILWGGSDRLHFGDNHTIIYDITSTGFFGYDVDMGYLDSNDMLDLVVGAPIRNDLTSNRDQCGAVFIYYDVGDLRGEDKVISTRDAGPILYGSDPYDRLGRTVRLMDVDGDGQDDIFVSAPDSDGPLNNRKGSGTIYYIKGGEENEFPAVTDVDMVANRIIYGESGTVGDLPGDRIGDAFELADMDGDGDPEFVLGTSGKSRGDKAWIGALNGYGFDRIFGPGSNTVDLAEVPFRFRFWGVDQEDSLGSSLSAGDLNNDGVQDIIVGAPGADGEGNSRPLCGEAFILTGSSLFLGDPEISGEGVEGDRIFAGGGVVDLRIPYVNTRGASLHENLTLRIDPDGENIIVRLRGGNVSVDGDRFGMLDVNIGSHDISGIRGSFEISLEMDWYVPLGEDVDLEAVVEKSSGDTVRRLYPDLFSVSRDLVMVGEPMVYRNGARMINTMQWVRQDDKVTFSNLSAVYGDDPDRGVDPGNFSLELSLGEEVIMESEIGSTDPILHTTIPGIGNPEYSISIKSLTDPPAGLDRSYVPDLGDPKRFPFRVELDPVPVPRELSISPDGEEPGIHDDDGIIYLDWERPDFIYSSSSGLHHYTVRVEGGERIPKETGGLLGSYFVNDDYTGQVNWTTVGNIDESWDFGPNDELLPPRGFSVRWHGWISLDDHYLKRLALRGEGKATVILDGERILDSGDLGEISVSRDLDVEGFVPIEVYYRSVSMDSSVSLLYPDGTGLFFPVEKENLMYPSDRAEIAVDEGRFSAAVRTVSWVDRTSSPVTVEGINERSDPAIHLSGIPIWTKDDFSIDVEIEDPGQLPTGFGSDPLRYSIRRDGGDWSEWTNESLNLMALEGNRMGSELYIEVVDEESIGIRFRATDRAGNVNQSDPRSVRIDRDPPEIELRGPDLNKVFESPEISASIHVSDVGGSGVDGGGAGYRFMVVDGNWSDWISLQEEDPGEEITFLEKLKLDFGVFEIQFRALDMVGNMGMSEIYRITIREDVENDPPVPLIRSPREGGNYSVGSLIYFDAVGTTDDGEENPDHLTYSWVSDRAGLLGTGINISLRMSEGDHTVTLYVSDGTQGHNVSRAVNFTVSEPYVPENPQGSEEDDSKEGAWAWIVVAITAVLLLITALVVLASYRRSRGVEYRMDVGSDPEDYNSETGSEERDHQDDGEM